MKTLREISEALRRDECRGRDSSPGITYRLRGQLSRRGESMDRTRRMPSPAFVVSMIALFVSLVGTAAGGSDDNPFDIPRNSIGERELEKNAVGDPEIQNDAVDSGELKPEAVETENITSGAVPPLALKVQPSVGATNTNAQVIPNGSESSVGTPIAFDAENWDYPDTPMHDNVSKNTRLVAPIAGVYRVMGSVDWEANDAGWRRLTLWKGKLTPGPVPIESETLVATSMSGQLLGVSFGAQIGKTLRLDAGEWVVLHATQSSGGPLNIKGGGDSAASLSLRWESP